MSRTKELEDIRENFYHYFGLAGELGDQFKKHYEDTYADGVLNAKTKRLIALCGGIVAGCKGCILGQTELALEKGATVEEIMEVCNVAISLSGTLAGSQISLVLELLKEKGLV